MNSTDPKHPPLNTPLSAFTPEMLDALPVGSAFGETDTNGGVVEKHADGWHYRDRTACADFPIGYNQSRPLIRVGPEQASGPAPLPDPWPGMMACWTDSAGYTHRRKLVSSFTNDAGVTRFMAEGQMEAFVWSPDVVSEVRTPDGVTVWKRSGPRPLSTYTEEDRRTFPAGTKIGIYTKRADARSPVGEVWRAADGMTLMGAYVADAMSRSGDMLVHFPAKVTT